MFSDEIEKSSPGMPGVCALFEIDGRETPVAIAAVFGEVIVESRTRSGSRAADTCVTPVVRAKASNSTKALNSTTHYATRMRFS